MENNETEIKPSEDGKEVKETSLVVYEPQSNVIPVLAIEQDKTEEPPAPPEEPAPVQEYKWRPQDADREYIKSSTRSRVRNATVPANAIFKPAKPAPSIDDTGHKRVAVYARVSTKSTEQVSSIENQTKYYTEKIAKTPNWEMQDIYKDEGISGTSTKRRKDFQRMMYEAAQQNIDLILCASVSRFARDISDCIEHVRKLKTTNPSHPVGVYFETEDIYTLDPNVSERLEMHALFSGWESRNKSRRMILSYDQRICTGQYPVLDLLGYRHTEDGGLIIEPNEAITVKFIYLAFIVGYTLDQIAEILTEKQRPTLTGRTEWNSSMVKNIMTNERRWGDLDARKTICIDMKEHKVVKNKNLRDAAYIPDHHEAIVSPAIAKAALTLSSSKARLSSVPDTYVIDKGQLKGFVSISPAWKGMDNATLINLSEQVYTPEEQEELSHLSKIISGEEESKVLSMTFAGYEVPYGAYFITSKTPTLTISNKKITFNGACYNRLDNCKFVEILYHPILQIVAVRTCDERTPNSIQWIDDKGKEKRITTASAFTQAIYDRTNWVRNYKFKLKGVTRTRGNSKIILFYLDEPQILVNKNDIASDDAENNFTQYIPYKNQEEQPTTYKTSKRYAFPEKLAKSSNFGISIPLRRKRDKIIGNIDEQDIQEMGIRVENPLIGYIPTKDELWVEIEKLIASM